MPNAKHPRARDIVNLGLFAGLSSFREFEERVKGLAENKDRGDAFEVFAEAYLNVHRRHDVEQVWPMNVLPNELIQRFGLQQKDYGVDGLYKRPSGDFCAYQVKFRSGRTPLTWDELSTFFGLADANRFASRVVFTNSDELPTVINDRHGYFCIRGSDLDRLAPADFGAIADWLAEVPVITVRSDPKPHQLEALDKLAPALRSNDRVSAIMACGTGKTMVALWLAERMEAKLILVLVPSLALLRQTLHVWLKETRAPILSYLCVCSDNRVDRDGDEIMPARSELDFEVSTEPDNVRRFLDHSFCGVKIVFSTYQSAHVIGEALKQDEQFDFAIFDEAHKTAGLYGKKFSFALEDQKLPIRKRLFLTATPRHYNPHKREGDNDGEAELVFSMDNPEIYGPQAYRLTFSEAARLKIICNYKVIITQVDSKAVAMHLTDADVLVDGEMVRARQVANQLAIRDAVQQLQIKKAFTFHATVASAESFVSEGNEGLRMHLPNFQTFHVNGTMRVSERERILSEFKAADRAVVSNARCLTEGVDVPAVDMVVFLAPKKSKVDIVQAIGRAMRTLPEGGKTTGYVLLPLYLDQEEHESLEDAVRRTSFDDIWDVLQSLQEQDESLADLIQQAGERSGRGLGFDDSIFKEKIEFVGPLLKIESVRKAITTCCVEQLWSSWSKQFGKLKAFKERFGHTNVETNWAEDRSLAAWVSSQRGSGKNGKLAPDRYQRLSELGFIWDFQTQKAGETWMKFYRELEVYAKQHGNPHVPPRSPPYEKLGNWVGQQRQRKRGTYKPGGRPDPILPWQEELLCRIKFRWEKESFEDFFEHVRKFKAENNHCDIPIGSPPTDVGKCVNRLRTMKKKAQLTSDQITRLEELGFHWKSRPKALRNTTQKSEL